MVGADIAGMFTINPLSSLFMQSSRQMMLTKQKHLTRGLLLSCVVASMNVLAMGQSYNGGNADFALGGTGQFTTQVPLTGGGPVQGTANRTAGILFNFQHHPLTWAGVDLTYMYSRYSETYVSSGIATSSISVPLSSQEGTAAYLVHSHFRGFQPFVGIGGGALYFHPNSGVDGQLRATGLLEAGLDIPTINPHIGVRLQGRSLIYRVPTIGSPESTSSEFEVTVEPAAGIYVRF